MVVSALIHCALLHSVSDLETLQMNIQHSRIWEIVYDFQLDHNPTEATKNICCARKGENAGDYNIVTRCLKKFCLGCKNFYDQVRSGGPKIMDSKVVFSIIKVNSNRRGLGKTRHLIVRSGQSSSCPWERHLSCRILHHVIKILQNILWVCLIFVGALML